MIKKCRGCGAILQSLEEEKPGFIPQNVFDKALYCKRCFRLLHYKDAKVTSPLQTQETILKKITKDADIVFFLIDFLNIDTESMTSFQRIETHKVLLISKTDFIPKGINLNLVKENIRRIYHIEEEIIFVSAKHEINLGSILNKINPLKMEHWYFLGYTNSGKSTLLQALLKRLKIKSDGFIASALPNTTLDFNKIKINDNLYFYDSPGLEREYITLPGLKVKDYERMQPNHYLLPITYQVKDNLLLNLENMWEIEIEGTCKNSVVFYGSDNIHLKRIYKSKLVSSDVISFLVDKPSDLLIKGYGFFRILKPCQIKIKSDYLAWTELRESIMGGFNCGID